MSQEATTDQSAVIPAPAETGGRTFADMPISPEILSALTQMGFSAPTPIQAAAIEPALAGRDLILRAKTGTGKTAAFGIPMLDRIADGARACRGLVLAPTRELALQIATQLSEIGRFRDLQVAAIYGGVGFGPQIDALKAGAEVVVGTPGRLLDHIKRGNLKLDGVQWLVLDEADEMLSMGFLEDVRKIVDRTPDTRQTLLCSATINDSLQGFVGRYLKEPEHILLSADGDNVDTIENLLYETSPDYHKARALVDLLEKEQPTSAIIFCNTREDVQTVYTYLERQGFRAEMLTGELPQNKRERVMAKVRAGAVQFLVATDVAARGIDIQDLSHVINYALPDDAAVYLHRIGRTGRAGRSGTALALVGGADFSTRLTLERTHKVKFIVRDLPGPEELIRLRADRVGRTLRESAQSTAYEGYLDVARGLRDQPDADVLFATALRAWFLWERSRRQEAEPAEEAPAEAREERRDGDRRDGERRDDRGERRDDRGERRDDRGERRDDRRDGERRDGRRDDRGERREGDRRDDRRDVRRDDRGERRDGDRRDDRGERRRDDRGERREGDRREGDRREGDRREGDRREGDRRDDRRDRRERRPEGRPEEPQAEVSASAEPVVAPVAEPVAAEPERAAVEPERAAVEPEHAEPVAGEPAAEAGAEPEAKKRRRRRRRRSGAGGEAGAESGGDAGGEAGADPGAEDGE